MTPKLSQKISQAPLAQRFEHLLAVMSSERFLHMRGLNNDLPFYICEFPASQATDTERLQRQLINTLQGLSVPSLGGRGVKVLEINLYDLCIELLQNVLGIEDYLIPAIAERLRGGDYDVLFLCGIGEVFPYIRSHNVLNNLQSTAKDKPTVLFFPGEYRHSLAQGASLELFGLLHDDKYYRAFNIFETQA